jgi:hypothetical protein
MTIICVYIKEKIMHEINVYTNPAGLSTQKPIVLNLLLYIFSTEDLYYYYTKHVRTR